MNSMVHNRWRALALVVVFGMTLPACESGDEDTSAEEDEKASKKKKKKKRKKGKKAKKDEGDTEKAKAPKEPTAEERQKASLSYLKTLLAKPSQNKAAITGKLKSLGEPGFALAIARAKELIAEFNSGDAVSRALAGVPLDNLMVAIADVDLGTANIAGSQANKKICDAAKGTSATKITRARCK